MPSRNVLKIDVSDSYYHIYARGGSRHNIFLEPADYQYFLELLRRYLSPEDIRNNAGISYAKLDNDIELLAYCLMRNHFHLLVYQVNNGGMQRLMRGVMTAYSRYFNTKYRQSGSLFESRYKASRITTDEYLMHISRYIHLNPTRWREYPYSSLQYYLRQSEIDWLQEERILDLFCLRQAYAEFVEDYEAVKESLALIKDELAGED